MISPLVAQSVARNGRPIKFPVFTRGSWRTASTWTLATLLLVAFLGVFSTGNVAEAQALASAEHRHAGGMASTAQERPNIVYIMADDLGYNHMGSYGGEKIRTPNLDRLAEQGMRFTDVYAGASVCAPSRSVLLTGMHGGHTSMRGNSGGLSIPDDEITTGEVLQPAGYTTGIFGKWGLGDIGTAGVPWKQGFDEFFGYLHQVHAHFYYPYFLWQNDMKYYLPGNYGDRKQYSHDEIMAKAFDFVRENQDDPFFLYLSPTIPHTELLVPEDSYEKYEGEFPEPTPYIEDEPKHYADQLHPRTTFAAMVSRLDRDVGRLMDLLDDLGLADNTVVFFTSDNGGQLNAADGEFFDANDPLRGFKGELYEGGIRVPMLVRWPGHVEPGTVNNYAWYFPDVMPTLAEIAGADAPDDIDGVSVVPALRGEVTDGTAHEFMYWEQDRRGNFSQAVRMGNWKAIRHDTGEPLELYNLEEDIDESNNVAASHPSVVANIENYLKTARTEEPDYPPEVRMSGLPRGKSGYIIE